MVVTLLSSQQSLLQQFYLVKIFKYKFMLPSLAVSDPNPVDSMAIGQRTQIA